MTLLSAPSNADWTILEMGMNHLGEIKRLCEIGEPDVVGVTMVGWAHIENLGSQEKIAEAKEEIYNSAKPNASRVYNLDNPWTRAMAEAHSKKYGSSSLKVTFSNFDEKADVFIRFTDNTFSRVEGHIFQQPFTSPVGFFGEQNVVNLGCAIAMACACAETATKIIQALPRCSTGWGRNQWLTLPNGSRALFDAYNANPDSMRALLDNARKLNGRKFAILGDMLELGDYSQKFHTELGEQAATAGFEAIWFVGQQNAYFERGLKAAGFDKKLIVSSTCEESLALQLSAMLNPGDMVVIKASRGVGLERVLHFWGVSLAKN